MPDGSTSHSSNPSVNGISKLSVESPRASSDHSGTPDGRSCHSQEHWKGVHIDLDELQDIVCKFLRIPPSDCGPPVEMGFGNFARVYSFQLPERKVDASLVYPMKPLFKTENEVAAMDFVRSRTSLPVPKVFTYCSEANNPVGVEWLIMEHMPGVEMDEAWDDLGYVQKRRLALDIIDLYDQLYKLKVDGCGGIYHSVNSVDDSGLDTRHQRSPRWTPLSQEFLSLLKSLCNHSVHNNYELGPFNDVSMIRYQYPVPSPSATLPVFSSLDYIKLATYNKPTTAIQLPDPNLISPLAKNASNYLKVFTNYILIQRWSVHHQTRSTFVFLMAICTAEIFSSTQQQEQSLESSTGKAPDFLHGAIELRAIYHAAIDDPLPDSFSDTFLTHYCEQGFWNEKRRGPFPWDMDAWWTKFAKMAMMTANGTMPGVPPPQDLPP